MENCVRDAIHDVNINILWDYSSNERIALLVTRKSYFIGSKSDFVLKNWEFFHARGKRQFTSGNSSLM